MATGTAVMVISALAAGVVGAGTVLLVSGNPPLQTPPAPSSDGGLAALERRIALQEELIRGLRASIEEIELAPRLPPPGPGAGPPPGDSSEGIETGEEDDFESRLERMRSLEQEGGRRGRSPETEEGLRARLDANTALGLTTEQKDGMVRALLDQSVKLRALFEESRTSGSPESMTASRQKSAEIRAETRRTLEGILTAEQMKAFEGGGERRTNRFGGRPAGGARGPRQGGGAAAPGRPVEGGGGAGGRRLPEGVPGPR